MAKNDPRWQDQVVDALERDIAEATSAEVVHPMPRTAWIPRPSEPPRDLAPDPIIRGLLAHLPAPGDVWPEDKRKLWISLVENSFKLIYRDSE